MHTRILYLMLILIATSSFFVACTAPPCDDVVCANNGVCNGGACFCESGFEGNRCETMSRDKFLGTYSVIEDGTLSLPATYAVNIHTNTSGAINEVRIKGFNNYFQDECVASCKGDSMVIARQTLSGKNVVEGYGIYSSSDYYGTHGTMKVYYSVTDSNGNVDDYGLTTNPNHASDWSK